MTSHTISITACFLVISLTALNFQNDKAFGATVNGIDLKEVYICFDFNPTFTIEDADCRLGGTSSVVTGLDNCEIIQNNPDLVYRCETSPDKGSFTCKGGFEVSDGVHEYDCIKDGSIDDLSKLFRCAPPEGNNNADEDVCLQIIGLEFSITLTNCSPNGEFIQCDTDDPDTSPVTCFAPDLEAFYYCVEGTLINNDDGDNGNDNGHGTRASNDNALAISSDSTGDEENNNNNVITLSNGELSENTN
jgi:hypothetical protein